MSKVCAFSRYETRVFLKNSGVSYLYGSISYLFGYEKNRCFSLMVVLCSKLKQFQSKILRKWVQGLGVEQRAATFMKDASTAKITAPHHL